MKLNGLLAAIVLLGLMCASRASTSPPRNPFLAASPFPICHGDTWCSDSSPLPGLPSANATVSLLSHPARLIELADPISLVYGPDGHVWASSVSHIMRIEVTPTSISLLAELAHNFSTEFHGAYSLVTRDNVFYASDMVSIGAFTQPSGQPRGPISRRGDFYVPGCVSGEHLVGLSMTYDGFLVYATSAGRVGVVSLDFSYFTEPLQLPGRDRVALPLKMVSNSFPVDQNNGVYVVTSIHQNRLQWHTLNKSLTLSWSQQYSDGRDPWFYGRLGPGAGSSPTVVGPAGTPEFVVITDGETPMNIRFYNASSGQECGAASVRFGPAGNSTSEQSVVVAGYRAVVVNNWWTGEIGEVCENVTRKNEWISHTCPAIMGEAAYGVAQYTLDPASCRVSLSWVNSKVSCTSSIPIVSTATNTLFCLGKRDDTFTIEALDWLTGDVKFHVPLGPGLQYNSMYAGTEIGAHSDILIGTLAGILHVAPKQ